MARPSKRLYEQEIERLQGELEVAKTQTRYWVDKFFEAKRKNDIDRLVMEKRLFDVNKRKGAYMIFALELSRLIAHTVNRLDEVIDA